PPTYNFAFGNCKLQRLLFSGSVKVLFVEPRTTIHGPWTKASGVSENVVNFMGVSGGVVWFGP
ncbi:hypothetical protein, partial [Bifidobacterium longum]|uniref:hypothetical protein n=1 Tax=Bifidobacterium longum TaxID=216816 RepID=UPI001F2054E4